MNFALQPAKPLVSIQKPKRQISEVLVTNYQKLVRERHGEEFSLTVFLASCSLVVLNLS
jgi:hypothetical protein